MKPVCIIPARGGSKGVPKKNIRLIAGKPLIYYAIKSALESKIFSHVIVSTEDKKLWKDPNKSDEWKKSNLELTRSRLNGWQQEAWDKSYAYKIETGLSLIKKKLLQQKK